MEDNASLSEPLQIGSNAFPTARAASPPICGKNLPLRLDTRLVPDITAAVRLDAS
jgi:hypothetical protein